MKKLLIGTAAVAMGLAFAAPAKAEGIKLDLGGHFKGYGAWADQDGAGTRDIDILRETEVHFMGETTLDNGLTVGASLEADIDDPNGDSWENEESYVYFSGNWGRFNFGKEDGAAYLLQVAAPSADNNVDGLRQYVQASNFSALLGTPIAGVAGVSSSYYTLDYDQNVSGYDNKITYITPVFEGFQAGFSYTPDLGSAGSNGPNGVGLDNIANEFYNGFDAAVRYEGQFQEVGVAVGAGYSRAELDDTDPTLPVYFSDNREAWNGGIDLDWGAFGLGAVYKQDSYGQPIGTTGNGSDDEQAYVIGADYTVGPFKIGASYFTAENVFGFGGVDADRYTGGVVYTYGPGMTFRGSVQYTEFDNLAAAFATPAANDAEATSVLIGTQINF